MTANSIPGEPGGLHTLASQLLAAAEDMDAVRGRVDINGLQGSWSGYAADAFRGALHDLPGELGNSASAFAGAGNAVNAFASRLAEIQHEARWHERQLEDAESERQAVTARQQSATAELDAARLRHSLATDPLSLQTAKAAVDAGERAVGAALADLEELAGRITRLTQAANGLRADYEQAVYACCNALEGVRGSGGHSLGGWLTSALAGLVGVAGPTAASWWLGDVRGLEADAGQLTHGASTLQSLLDDADHLVEQGVPVSMLGRWASSLIRVADSPAFRFVGRASAVLQAYFAYDDARTAWSQTGWENPPGREFTVGATIASDAVLAWWPADVANLATGGALSADIKGIGLIGGGLITEGLPGALRGDEQFEKNALSGEYGGFVRDVAVDTNFAIEHTAELPSAMLQGTEDLAKEAWQDGTSMVTGTLQEASHLLKL